MSSAAKKVVSEGQSFLGGVVNLYATRDGVEGLLEKAEKAGIRLKYDERAGAWACQAAMQNFKDPAFNALVKEHGAFSEAYKAARREREEAVRPREAAPEAAKQEPAREMKPDEMSARLPGSVVTDLKTGERTVLQSAAAPEKGGSAPIVDEVARRAVPLTDVDATRYAARAAWAKKEGREFLASYVRFGFSLAGSKQPERRQEQLGELAKASPEDIREIADRNSQRYGELARAEDRKRFDFVVQTDPEWRAKAEALPKDDRLAREGLFDEFTRLDHTEKRELASAGREKPVGLSDSDRGLMVSLSGGWRALEDRYFELTNERFSQGIVSAAMQRNSPVDISAGSLRSVAAETARLEGPAAVAAKKVRDAVDVEI
jgi:hypothetical protein